MKKSSVLLLVCIVSATLIVLAKCFAATSAPGDTTLVGRYQLFQGSYTTERNPVIVDRKVIFLLDTITGKVKRYSAETSDGKGIEKWSDIDYPTN